MIKNGYVIAILANDKVAEEDSSGKVCLPFGQEFKVRLINKNYIRCAADLIINGESVARFLVDGGQTTDIERYVDSNLYGGSKFKFTHLHDGQVKDKNSFENGIVEVLFYKEIIKRQEPIVLREPPYKWPWDEQKPHPKPSSPWDIKYGSASDMQYCAQNNAGFGANNAMLTCNFMAADMGTARGISTGAEGATVRGSHSSQKFSEVSGLEFESVATVIKLKIVNGTLEATAKYCTSCGRKKQGSDKFCSQCGNKY